MNQFVKEENQELDGFELAKKLREEAQLLEDKERMKRRLLSLIEISKDPYYDQYLNQMLKDLLSGKATPKQVEREADRTYRIYLERTGQVEKTDVPTAQPVTATAASASSAPAASIPVAPATSAARTSIPVAPATSVSTTSTPAASIPAKKKDAVEFKIGAGIFSTVGAVFVLASLVIFGFNYLEGVWQGLCLYAAAVAVILISELLIKRLSRPFSLVTTGIGISSLFIATVINYLVLENINGLIASLITLAIAVFSILFSRKKDATSIRLISIFGSYISFFPIDGFDTELSFLIMVGMLLMINLASIFLPNQSNRSLIAGVHIAAHTLFTGIVTAILVFDYMKILFVVCFVIISLALVNLIYWQQKEEKNVGLTILYSIAMGIFAIILLCVVYRGDNLISGEELFNRIIAEVMAVAVAVIFYILWGQRKERYIQYYFGVSIIVLLSCFNDCWQESVIALICLFLATRVLSVKRDELNALDAILAVLVTLEAMWIGEEWYVVFPVAALLVSTIFMRKLVLFHEINVTVCLVSIAVIVCSKGWSVPAILGILFGLFMLFNHLPKLKEQTGLPYNIVNLSMAALFSISTISIDNYWTNAVAMLIGVVMILTVFRKRYHLDVPKKYFILFGYLVYMIMAAGFKTPVVVSALLMVVSIVSVAVGFKLKDKSYRISGLILAVFVCVKLIIFDFAELETLPKALLFLIVGIIALVISFLYIYLEKKEDKEEETGLSEAGLTEAVSMETVSAVKTEEVVTNENAGVEVTDEKKGMME